MNAVLKPQEPAILHGVAYGLSAEAYFAHEAASNSFNKLILEHSGSPEEAKAERDELDKDTAAKQFGTAFHAAMLEPDTFESRFVTVPDDAPRRPSITQINAKKPSADTLDAIAWWESFNARNEGKTVMKAEDHSSLCRMRDKVHAHPDVRDLFHSAPYKTEVSIFSTDPDGICRKCRIDHLLAGTFISDFKSAASVTDEAIAKAIYDRGYFMQDPWYSDLAEEHNIDVSGFVFVFCLKTPPYSVRVKELGETERELGRKANAKAFRIYRECTLSGRWPGYQQGISRAYLPAWAYSRLENLE